MRSRIAVLSGLLLMLSAAGFGQAGVAQRVGPAPGEAASKGSQVHKMVVVQGHPYSAEEIQESNQTLADGTHISTSRLVQRMYRDSAGRVRIERPIGAGNPPARMLVEISDPVAGFRFTLQTNNKIAQRVKLEALPQTQAPTPLTTAAVGMRNAAAQPGAKVAFVGQKQASAAGARAEHSTESLGTREMEGVMAEGTLDKTTYPVGAIGNDRPIVVLAERWYSPDLQATVLRKNVDPRSGENVTRWINISRADPEYSLFQPPPDYRIVDGALGGILMH